MAREALTMEVTSPGMEVAPVSVKEAVSPVPGPDELLQLPPVAQDVPPNAAN